MEARADDVHPLAKKEAAQLARPRPNHVILRLATPLRLCVAHAPHSPRSKASFPAFRRRRRLRRGLRLLVALLRAHRVVQAPQRAEPVSAPAR